MHHQPRLLCSLSLGCVALLLCSLLNERLEAGRDVLPDDTSNDPVIARIHEHLGEAPRPTVLVVGARDFPPSVWNRVKGLVAFRVHRHGADGTTTVDAAIYLLRDSTLYSQAQNVLRSRTTHLEYTWCLLASVIAHEMAHVTPLTERQALNAEAAQLRRCLSAGHLFSGDGWNPLTYLGKVEAKLRNPREHY